MLLETSFLLFYLFCNVDFELIQLIEFKNYWALINLKRLGIKFESLPQDKFIEFHKISSIRSEDMKKFYAYIC